MRYFVAVVLCALTACAAIAAPDETANLVLPSALKAQCEAEGGCILVTQKRLEQEAAELAVKLRAVLEQEADAKCSRGSLRSI